MAPETYLSVRRDVLLFLALALLRGPKIVLLMPLWWGGVYLYSSKALKWILWSLGWFLLVLSLLGFASYSEWGIAARGRRDFLSLFGSLWAREFVSSQRFPSDYFLGVYLAAHFVGLRTLFERYTVVPEVAANRSGPSRVPLSRSTFCIGLSYCCSPHS